MPSRSGRGPTTLYTSGHGDILQHGCRRISAGADPEKHLHETGKLIVCPVCLTEKSPELTKKLERDGTVIYFCRCPLCMEAFEKNPEYYIRRLEGKEDYSGTFLAASSPE